MSHVAVIGDGGWGTALALVLVRNGHSVRLWSAFPDYAKQLQQTRENVKFLPEFPLLPGLDVTADAGYALDSAEAVVLAVPSRFFRDVVVRIAPDIPAAAHVVSVAKGLDRQTGQRMTQTAASLLNRTSVAALSGPSHAEEVARGVPTALSLASLCPVEAEALRTLFAGPVFRIYTTDDVAGVELGGALKNVIAIAAGACDGLGFGDNTKAALMTRGLAEIKRLGVALGAHPETFFGLSGLGDLIVTCTSRWSRNRAVGERLGRGEPPDQVLGSMEQVAEGVWTCATAVEQAERAGVEVPIASEVNKVLHHGKNPREAVQTLLLRDPRAERDLP